MIYYSIPYNVNKCIAKYYNSFMNILPSNNDYACFIDGDATFTTNNWGHQLHEVTERYKSVRLFYATTNRIGCPWQKAPGAPTGNDVAMHRKFGAKRAKMFGSEAKRVRESMGSGFFILLRKDLWKEVGGFEGDGILGVDWKLFRKINFINEPIYQILGVYLYHWYRGGTGDKRHLI